MDCSFDDLMAERDIVKLSKQIQRCYALNRHMAQPIQFHLTNIQGKTLSRMDDHVDGYKNWDVHIKSESLSELFPRSTDVVYLCAESENTLTEFDDNKIYAIGGFVDHNAHKGVAYERAVAAGFSHARLPIDSFFTLATRKVLTVCHVFEIIKNFTESGNWEEAIKLTVPARKGLETKTEGESMMEGESKAGGESMMEGESKADKIGETVREASIIEISKNEKSSGNGGECGSPSKAENSSFKEAREGCKSQGLE